MARAADEPDAQQDHGEANHAEGRKVFVKERRRGTTDGDVTQGRDGLSIAEIGVG